MICCSQVCCSASGSRVHIERSEEQVPQVAETLAGIRDSGWSKEQLLLLAMSQPKLTFTTVSGLWQFIEMLFWLWDALARVWTEEGLRGSGPSIKMDPYPTPYENINPNMRMSCTSYSSLSIQMSKFHQTYVTSAMSVMLWTNTQILVTNYFRELIIILLTLYCKLLNILQLANI